jgi:putative transposase
MVHLVARSLDGTLLFRDHAEARALFDILASAFPDAEAICLMPDHVHLVVPDAGALDRLRAALSGFARWRNARRSTSGPVWRPAPAAEPLPDALHAHRTVRYVHLNPCRAGLVADPLAWPWSTHRDATGFAAAPVRPRVHEPERFHAYVSGDPSVRPEGTSLPETNWARPSWEAVADAAAGVCREPIDAARRRGPCRRLAVRAAWFLQLHDAPLLAREAGLARAGIYRVIADLPGRGSLSSEPALYACVRAVGDPRVSAVPTGDLRHLRGWERYRRLA